MSTAFFCPPLASLTGHEIAYTGLVKLHAHQVLDSPTFERTGRLTTGQVRSVALDLALLDRPHDLDDTIETILAEADRRDLEHQAQADAEFRAREQRARLDAADEQRGGR